MKFHFNSIFIFVLLLISPLSKALVMGASLWKKMVNEHPHYLIFFHDFHINLYENDTNAVQRQDLLEKLQSLQSEIGADNVMVICEDISHYSHELINNENQRNELNKDYKNREESLKVNSQRFICGLTHACQDKKISASNVECRQLLPEDKVVMLSGVRPAPGAFELLLTPQSLGYQNMRKKLSEFNGNPVVVAYTKNILDSNDKTLAHLKKFNAQTDYSKVEDWNRAFNDYYVAYKAIFNKCVDLNILHMIIAQQDKTVQVVCAGSDHLANLISLLPALGYERVPMGQDRLLKINDETLNRIDLLSNSEGNLFLQRLFRPIDIKNVFSVLNEHIEWVFL